MILCLNPYFNDLIRNDDVKFINDIFPDFNNLTIKNRLLWLKRNGKDYDTIVFYRDHRLALLYNILFKRRCQKTILHEFYCPQQIGWFKHLYFKLLFRSIDKTIVHSRFETETLAHIFGINKSRFEFIRYFCYGLTMQATTDKDTSKRLSVKSHGQEISSDDSADKKINILVPGRHRDLKLLNTLKKYDNLRFTIVCGESDTICLTGNDFMIKHEIPKEEYNRIFESANLILIPLKAGLTRSLGQIAVMKAFASRKPLIISKSKVIEDYIIDSGCIQYEAENTNSLEDAIDRYLSMTDSELAEMTDNAHKFIMGFRRENYAAELNRIIHNP